MRCFRDPAAAAARLRGAAAAIGNFDGLHLGHRAAIDRAAALARAEGRPLLLLTFEPHPRRVFRPGLPPFLLTAPRERLERARALGVDGVLAFRFTRAFAARSAESFARETLAGVLGLRAAAVGEGFRFGAGRAGDAGDLERAGVEALRVAPARDRLGEVVSSSRARDLLRAGRPGEAAALLGRPFALEGRVARGRGAGRGLGMPTANLPFSRIGGGAMLRPAFGVYAVRVGLDGAAPALDGVANLGLAPMRPHEEPTLEAHVIGAELGPLAGRRMRVELIARLRGEEVLADDAALSRRMRQDAEEAKAALAGAGPAAPGPPAAGPAAPGRSGA